MPTPFDRLLSGSPTVGPRSMGRRGQPQQPQRIDYATEGPRYFKQLADAAYQSGFKDETNVVADEAKAAAQQQKEAAKQQAAQQKAEQTQRNLVNETKWRQEGRKIYKNEVGDWTPIETDQQVADKKAAKEKTRSGLESLEVLKQGAAGAKLAAQKISDERLSAEAKASSDLARAKDESAMLKDRILSDPKAQSDQDYLEKTYGESLTQAEKKVRDAEAPMRKIAIAKPTQLEVERNMQRSVADLEAKNTQAARDLKAGKGVPWLEALSGVGNNEKVSVPDNDTSNERMLGPDGKPRQPVEGWRDAGASDVSTTPSSVAQQPTPTQAAPNITTNPSEPDHAAVIQQIQDKDAQLQHRQADLRARHQAVMAPFQKAQQDLVAAEQRMRQTPSTASGYSPVTLADGSEVDYAAAKEHEAAVEAYNQSLERVQQHEQETAGEVQSLQTDAQALQQQVAAVNERQKAQVEQNRVERAKKLDTLAHRDGMAPAVDQARTLDAAWDKRLAELQAMPDGPAKEAAGQAEFEHYQQERQRVLSEGLKNAPALPIKGNMGALKLNDLPFAHFTTDRDGKAWKATVNFVEGGEPIKLDLPDITETTIKDRISANEKKLEKLKGELDDDLKYNDDPAFAAGDQEQIAALTAENQQLAQDGLHFLQAEAVQNEIKKSKYKDRFPSGSLFGDLGRGVVSAALTTAVAARRAGNALGITTDQELADQIEAAQSASQVMPGSQWRHYAGGTWNDSLTSGAESTGQMLPTIIAAGGAAKLGTSLVNKIAGRAAAGEIGALAPTLTMAPTSFGSKYGQQITQAIGLEEQAEAAKKAGKPEAAAKFMADAKALRSTADAAGLTQAAIDTGTEMIFPEHAIFKSGLKGGVARAALVAIQEGPVEEGIAQILQNALEPATSGGVNKPALTEGLGTAMLAGMIASVPYAGAAALRSPTGAASAARVRYRQAQTEGNVSEKELAKLKEEDGRAAEALELHGATDALKRAKKIIADKTAPEEGKKLAVEYVRAVEAFKKDPAKRDAMEASPLHDALNPLSLNNQKAQLDGLDKADSARSVNPHGKEWQEMTRRGHEAAMRQKGDEAASDAELSADQTGMGARARIVRDIAQGKSLDALDEHELKPIGIQRTDKGAYKEATGKDAAPPALKIINGKPVILQTELDAIASAFPNTRSMIGMSESEARAKAIGTEQSSQADASNPQPKGPDAEPAAGSSGNAPATGGASPVGPAQGAAEASPAEAAPDSVSGVEQGISEQPASSSEQPVANEQSANGEKNVPRNKPIEPPNTAQQWSAESNKGTRVTAPAKSRAEAQIALASKVPAGEVLDVDTIAPPAKGATKSSGGPQSNQVQGDPKPFLNAGFVERDGHFFKKIGGSVIRVSLRRGEVHIVNIAVPKADQGQRIGSTLIEEVKRLAGEQPVTLVPHPDEKGREADLNRFYERLGFTRDGNEYAWNLKGDRYPKPTTPRDQIMQAAAPRIVAMKDKKAAAKYGIFVKMLAEAVQSQAGKFTAGVNLTKFKEDGHPGAQLNPNTGALELDITRLAEHVTKVATSSREKMVEFLHAVLDEEVHHSGFVAFYDTPEGKKSVDEVWEKLPANLKTKSANAYFAVRGGGTFKDDFTAKAEFFRQYGENQEFAAETERFIAEAGLMGKWRKLLEAFLRSLEKLRTNPKFAELAKRIDEIQQGIKSALKRIEGVEEDSVATKTATTEKPAQAEKTPAKSPEKPEKKDPRADAPKSSTQLTLSKEAAKPFVEFAESIPDSELHTPDKEWADDARETEPHITVLYGLTEHDPAPVEKVIRDHAPPVLSVRLGKLSIFSNDEYDVLKVDVYGDNLKHLNKWLQTLPHYSSFPDYHPHMTIAYLKKGEGAKYVGDARFEGQVLKFDSITHSPPPAVREKQGRKEMPLAAKVKNPAVAETQRKKAEKVRGASEKAQSTNDKSQDEGQSTPTLEGSVAAEVTATETPKPAPAQRPRTPAKYRDFDAHGRPTQETTAPHEQALTELRARESVFKQILDCLGKKGVAA